MKKDLKITYLKKPMKFLKKNSSTINEKEVDNLVVNLIRKHFFNMDINIDYKLLQGKLKDFFRIRKGDIRIILSIHNNEIIIEAIIEDIGFRGDIY